MAKLKVIKTIKVGEFTFSKLCTVYNSVLQGSYKLVKRQVIQPYQYLLYETIQVIYENSTKTSVKSRYDTEFFTNYMCLFRVCETTVSKNYL